MTKDAMARRDAQNVRCGRRAVKVKLTWSVTLCSAGRGRRNDRHEDDEGVLRPSSPRDPHAVRPHARTQVHAHDPDRERRSCVWVCTDRDWLLTLQSYVHRRGRHVYGANAHHAGNQRVHRGGWPYGRSWVRGRAGGSCAWDRCKLSWISLRPFVRYYNCTVNRLDSSPTKNVTWEFAVFPLSQRRRHISPASARG
jgi:hypothetical protein